MDIFAHALWTGGLFKLFNKNKKLNIKLGVFWGVFPDFFAFTIPFIYIFYKIIFSGFTFSPPNPNVIEPVGNIPMADLAYYLYNISHSLIIFSIIFIITLIILKKPFYEFFGWLLHILIDIPTHPYNFFPTPFLWPISNLKFLKGISWGNQWFIIFNYSLLIIFYVYLFKNKILKK